VKAVWRKIKDLLKCGHVVGTELYPVVPEDESSHACKVESLDLSFYSFIKVPLSPNIAFPLNYSYSTIY